MSYELITRNLQEFIGDPEELKKIVADRQLKVYFGTAPTGRIHIGYFVPLLKMADLLDAGCSVKILLADLHAFLDARKSPLEMLENRSKYYEQMLTSMLQLLNADTKNLQFVKGTSFQLSPKYSLDVYKALSLVSVNDAKHAGADVVRQSDNPMMNSLIYPTLQALDEEYLDVDAELSGIDQRKIAVHARAIMPQLGYKKRMYFMTPMVPALSTAKTDPSITTKMSSSENSTKVDLLDDPKTLQKKIKSVYCLEGDIKDNTLLVMIRMILFPLLARLKRSYKVTRNPKYGGDVEYVDYGTLEQDFADKKLHPGDLKKSVSDILGELLKPIRDKFEEPANKEIMSKSYTTQ
jgi:tyrosyl-tRNA synthetase